MKLTSNSVVAVKVTIRDWSTVDGSIQGGRGEITSSHNTCMDLWVQDPETKNEECITLKNKEMQVRESNALRVVKCNGKPVAIRNFTTGQTTTIVSAENFFDDANWTVSAVWWGTFLLWLGAVGLLFVDAMFFHKLSIEFLDTLWVFPICFVGGLFLTRSARATHTRKIQEFGDEIHRLLSA